MRKLFALLTALACAAPLLAGCADTRTFDSAPIPITYDEDMLSEAAAEKIADFYYAIETKNDTLYTSLLCNEFLAYSEFYWKQNGYTAQQLLKSYYNDLSTYTEGDFTVTAIEVTGVRCDDGTAQAVAALDTISEQMFDKKASSYWTDCVTVSCNLTLKGTISNITFVKPESRIFVIRYEAGDYLAIFDDAKGNAT